MLHQNHITKTKSLWSKNRNIKYAYPCYSLYYKINHRLKTNQHLNFKNPSLFPAYRKAILIDASYLPIWNSVNMITLYKVYHILQKYVSSNPIKLLCPSRNNVRNSKLLQLL